MLTKFKENHPAIYNLVTRALWTFLQAFLGTLIILPSMDKKALYGAIIGAIGAGLSAVKTLIVDYAQKKLEESKPEDEGDA